jgi:hypothetical protein
VLACVPHILVADMDLLPIVKAAETSFVVEMYLRVR